MALEPITRTEQIMSGKSLTPITREEMFLAKAGGQDVQIPTPVTRKEMFLQKIAENGSGSGGSSGGFDFVQDDAHSNAVVGENLFAYNNELTSVKMTRCGGVGKNAFRSCQNLASVHLNNNNYFNIGDYAFADCYVLRKVEAMGVSAIGTNAFRDCKTLESVNVLGVKKDGSYSPTNINGSAFMGCESLTNVHLMANLLDDSCFEGCINLETFVAADVQAVGIQAFAKCTSLSKVSLEQDVVGAVEATYTIGVDAFWKCSNLRTLILGGTHAAWNVDFSAFNETPMLTGEGHIYVPSVMYEYYREGYEVAINQLMPGFFEILFRKIEDYPEIRG